MRVPPTKEQRDSWLLEALRVDQPVSIVNFAATPDGPEMQISDEVRNQLLAKCAAGEYVELIVDVLAYEHKLGSPNRQFIKIRDGNVMTAAKTAIGKPFIRDHRQADLLSRAGTILESRGVRRGDGDYTIMMRVKLTAPWAVEMALRGLLTFVSVGLQATGPVVCSYCGTEVLTECLHLPGEEIVAKPGATPVVCEWVLTSAEIVECSATNVPAVPGAHIEGIRAALSAALGGNPPERKLMRFSPALLALLSLAATASEDEVLAAVETNLKTNSAQLSIVTKDLETVTAERDELKAAKLAAECKSFVEEAINLGQIAPSDRETWTELYTLSKPKAIEMMAKRPPNVATPAGAGRQTPVIDPGVKPKEETPVIEFSSGAHRQTFQGRVKAQLAAAIAEVVKNPRAAQYAAYAFGIDGGGKIKAPAFQLGATAINNAADLEAVKIGYQAAMLEAVVGEPDPCMQIAQEVPSTHATENYKWLGDLPQMEEWKNDRVMAMLEAYEWAIKNKQWQATLRVKNNDFRDDNLGLLPSHVNSMGEEARLQPALLVVRLLLNGFDGTAFPELGDGLAFDGSFFFDTAHPTGSNKLALALTGPSLSTAMTMLRTQKRFDLKSNLYARGTHLIVGPDNEENAEKLMTAELLANAAGTATETNTKRGKFKIIVTPEFENGEWCLADLSKSVKPMLFQNREGITTQTVGGRSGDGKSDFVGFMYDETWFSAETRNNAGYWDHRRIIGSKP